MVVQIMFAYSVLVYVDSGAPVPKFLSRSRISSKHGVTKSEVGNDVLDEKDRLNRGANDILKVMSLSKRYPGAPDHSLAVDDVTFGTDVGENTALIGPNGAGKTTTLACIRGVVSQHVISLVSCSAKILTARFTRMEGKESKLMSQ